MRKILSFLLSSFMCLFFVCSCGSEQNTIVNIVEGYIEPSLKPVVVSSSKDSVSFTIDFSGNVKYLINCTANLIYDNSIEQQIVIINLNEIYTMSNLKHNGVYEIKLKYNYYTDETKKRIDQVSNSVTFQN